MDAKAFEDMSGPEIRSIFRHKDILITGVKSNSLKFDLHTLGMLGNLDAKRDAQGKVFHVLEVSSFSQ